jgi:predicted ATPase/DNA-binding winged helix-turn-helix (wHTH) protein
MPVNRAANVSGQISFGPFRLLPYRQLLLEGDKAVRLGSRACEILTALVERPGELLSKQELMERVWPDTFVEDGSLRVHVAALRRALGDGQAGRRYIANVPGRGYRFVGSVSLDAEPTAPPAVAPGVRPPTDLPVSLARVLGRADIVDKVAEQLAEHRFITIVGPGGIGKTTVAVAVADSLHASFRDGVRFVDLAPLSDPQLVPQALASLLGISVRADQPLAGLISFLRDKEILIVLDSCEHVVEATAALAEEIFAGTKRTHVLATSREALRVKGERVHNLAPLRFPSDIAGLTAAEALAYPSVQLFVEQAAASLGAFELTDTEAPLVADICRRLDGIPLAIEIVAGQVEAFGTAGLAARLATRLPLLAQGRRTARPRHRTLAATLDWSYAQLPELEQLVLRRLSVFAGTFTMESASAVLAGAGMPAAEVVDAIASLIAKSLVAARVDGAIALYRLLDTTRAYLIAKLAEAGERQRLSSLHARHNLSLLERAEADWQTRPVREWRELHRHIIDNVRAALDWDFSSDGDAAAGIGLTVAAVPLWFALSLTSECAERIDRALAAPAASRSAESEMRLYAARAWSLMQTKGAVPETRTAWAHVLAMSEQLGNVDYQLRALWGLWSGLLNGGEFRAALALAERFSELARRHADTTDSLVGDRMVGYILHLLGDQPRARLHIERMLSRYQVPLTGAEIIRFIFDQRATAQCFLARIFWLQGFADKAVSLVNEVVDGALASGDVLSLCQTLVQAACPVAFFVGDLDTAERRVRMLLDNAQRLGLDFWHAYGRCFEAVLVIKRGELIDGLTLLDAALIRLRSIQFGVYYSVFLAEFADALGRVGRLTEGQAAIDEALARCEENDERWYWAELLRVKGELTLRGSDSLVSKEAEQYFLESLEWSKRQETLAWELRTTTSLAALWRDGNRVDQARKAISASYARFNEGFQTADLRAAARLINDLA